MMHRTLSTINRVGGGLFQHWCQPPKRNLFGWLNVIFNNVDHEMIKQYGPNVAAAQWLVRNGAKASFQKAGNQIEDYDRLVTNQELCNDYIIAIDASGSSISHVGFPYLKNLKNLRKIVFKENKYLEDKALQLLAEYKLPLLNHLQIINCAQISDKGVLALQQLQTLEYLKLQQLLSVNEPKTCLETLKSSLSKCTIEWSDVNNN